MTKKMLSYSTEFKAESVKKIADNNTNLSVTPQQLGIAIQTLSNLYKKTSQKKLVSIEPYDTEIMAAIEEIKQFK